MKKRIFSLMLVGFLSLSVVDTNAMHKSSNPKTGKMIGEITGVVLGVLALALASKGIYYVALYIKAALKKSGVTKFDSAIDGLLKVLVDKQETLIEKIGNDPGLKGSFDSILSQKAGTATTLTPEQLNSAFNKQLETIFDQVFSAEKLTKNQSKVYTELKNMLFDKQNGLLDYMLKQNFDGVFTQEEFSDFISNAIKEYFKSDSIEVALRNSIRGIAPEEVTQSEAATAAKDVVETGNKDIIGSTDKATRIVDGLIKDTDEVIELTADVDEETAQKVNDLKQQAMQDAEAVFRSELLSNFQELPGFFELAEENKHPANLDRIRNRVEQYYASTVGKEIKQVDPSLERVVNDQLFGKVEGIFGIGEGSLFDEIATSSGPVEEIVQSRLQSPEGLNSLAESIHTNISPRSDVERIKENIVSAQDARVLEEISSDLNLSEGSSAKLKKVNVQDESYYILDIGKETKVFDAQGRSVENPPLRNARGTDLGTLRFRNNEFNFESVSGSDFNPGEGFKFKPGDAIDPYYDRPIGDLPVDGYRPLEGFDVARFQPLS